MEQTVWSNKIQRYEIVNIDELLANPHNWKIHPKKAQDALEGSLDDLGIIKPPIINVRQHPGWPPDDRGVEVLLDGHRRVMVALRRGQPTWPAVYVNLSPEEEAEALVIVDKLTGLSVTDKDLLSDILRDFTTGNSALQELINDIAMQEGIAPPLPNTIQPAPTKPLPEQWMIVVTCANEAEQVALFTRFQSEGLQCRLLVA